MHDLYVLVDEDAFDAFVEALIELVIERLETPEGDFNDYLIDETLEEIANMRVTVAGWDKGKEMAAGDLIKEVVAFEEKTNFTYNTDVAN